MQSDFFPVTKVNTQVETVLIVDVAVVDDVAVNRLKNIYISIRVKRLEQNLSCLTIHTQLCPLVLFIVCLLIDYN